jgi:hypothetical protein
MHRSYPTLAKAARDRLVLNSNRALPTVRLFRLSFVLLHPNSKRDRIQRRLAMNSSLRMARANRACLTCVSL